MGRSRYSSVNLLNLLVVAAGGAIGSAARYLLSQCVHRTTATTFPLGTFAVNLLGCIVFGAIAGAAEQRVPLAPPLRAFLLVGILGGFTTFSSYAFESVVLMRDGQLLAASLNIIGQVVAGLAGMWIAMTLSR